MKHLKKLLAFAATLLLSFQLVLPVSAAGSAYSYGIHAEPLAVRDPYRVSHVIDGEQMGIGSMKNPSSLYVKENLLYICDSGNNRILVLDEQLKLVEILESFTGLTGKPDHFNYPTDIAVSADGSRYIADSRNGRIVVLDKNGKCLRVIDKITSEMLADDFQFTPLKLSLDAYDNLYVVANGVNFGIMDLSQDGTVNSFLGAAKVSFDLELYLKKLLLSEEQVAQLTKIIPTEYNNIYMDKDNFIYGTINVIDPEKLKSHIVSSLYRVESQQMNQLNESLVDKILRMLSFSSGQSGENDVVKRLNMKGDDILVRSGYHPVVGDLEFETEVVSTGIKSGPSSFVDIVVRENGCYSVLDQNRNKVFTYDPYGVLLFAFGGTGKGMGEFEKASAIEEMNGNLLVSDATKNTVTVLEQTEFSKTVYSAVNHYSAGRYEEAFADWEASIALCSNFEVGYIGAGRCQLRLGEYQLAMENFELGEYREGYDQAFELYRQELLRGPWGSVIFTVILLLLGAVVVLRLIWKNR